MWAIALRNLTDPKLQRERDDRAQAGAAAVAAAFGQAFGAAVC